MVVSTHTISAEPSSSSSTRISGPSSLPPGAPLPTPSSTTHSSSHHISSQDGPPSGPAYKLATLNCNSFRGLIRRLQFLRTFDALRLDVVCLQETHHIKDFSMVTLPGFICLFSEPHPPPGRRGVAILARKAFLQLHNFRLDPISRVTTSSFQLTPSRPYWSAYGHFGLRVH